MKTKKLQIKHLLPVLAVMMMLLPAYQSEAAPDKQAESHKMQPDHAPTPFSAAQIRSGCPEGRKIVFQVESFGKSLMIQSIEFLTCQEKKVVYEIVTKGVDGKKMGPRKMITGNWKDLQAHASFPKAETVITNDTYTAPAGTFDCRLYTITGKTNTKRLWFAKEMPGPPLAFEEEANKQITMKMIMLKTGLKK
ncbi:MAG: hypothetical protein GY757_07870 [bacterium]|nr:hypothetical protein [bacterium]